jgi:diguanylate cyclase (GGDEF)-like protein
MCKQKPLTDVRYNTLDQLLSLVAQYWLLVSRHLFIILIALLTLVVTPVYSQQALGLALTQEENQWIAQNKLVTVAFDGYFPPYSFLNDEQKLEGFSVDLFNIISRETGLKFKTHPQYKWDEIFGAGKAKQTDIVATMVKNPDRLQWFNFTQAYIFKSLVITSRVDDKRINEKADIKNKTVALVKGYQYADNIIEQYPSITPVYFDTILDTLNAVSVGKADAAITFFGAGHYLRNKYLLTNLKYAAIFNSEDANERIAIRKDLPILSTIISKALSAISEAEYHKLRAKWLPVDDMEELVEIKLTKKEQLWIKSHPTIRLGVDPEYAPFEYMEGKQYKGMASDYVKLLNQRLKLNMQVVDNLNWNQVIQGVRTAKVDVLPVVSITAQRSKFLAFTEPYLNFHRVIVTRIKSPFISGLSDLEDKAVAAQENTSHYDFIIKNSAIKPTLYKDLQQSLLAVSSGKADAYIGNVAAATYWIRKLNLTNLKIAAPASTQVQSLRFAVRDDWPIFVSILQKGLDSISLRQKKMISEKWLSINYDPGVNYSLIWTIIGFASFLVLAITLWNIILNKRVKVRTSQLSYSANYDKLTGLPNRFLTLDRLKQSINEAHLKSKKIAVVSIEIDNFKTINSNFGTCAGDQVLQAFAQRLQNSLREHQQVGRLSGNHFLMIQSHIHDAIESAGLAEQIIACSAEPYTASSNSEANSPLQLNSSMGITIYPDDGGQAELLLKHADTAKQHAKKHMQGSYIYYSERLNSNLTRKVLIEKHLNSAIENDEFEVYYQPKLDPITRKSVSFEALLRWNSEALGSVSPAEFIPIAEKHEIINKIGLFVIQQALPAIQQWQKEYAVEFSIAINLSPAQFHDDDLIANIEHELSKHQLNPNTIEFEITEGVLLSKLQGIEDKLSRLEQLGVSLAMDDFGSGYSSLSYLRKYRFDTLKIDREFIAELSHSSADKKLVSAIIAMAHELDMKVVAEGVETPQQHTFLVEQHCDFVQGWLYSKALNTVDLKAYLDKQFSKS